MFGLAAAACCCERVPHDSYNTVCMFADVSGFTALGEAMLRKHGVGGAEYLARHLNSYFSQMVRIIAGEGGDIFKFAGDAMIVLWPDVDSVDMRCHRAAQVTPLARRTTFAPALLSVQFIVPFAVREGGMRLCPLQRCLAVCSCGVAGSL